MWHYLALYYISLAAVLLYARRGGAPLALALLNAGGLPPITGFMIKLRALYAIRAYMSIILLAGRGAALVSYVRLLLRARIHPTTLPIPLLIVVTLGSV